MVGRTRNRLASAPKPTKSSRPPSSTRSATRWRTRFGRPTPLPVPRYVNKGGRCAAGVGVLLLQCGPESYNYGVRSQIDVVSAQRTLAARAPRM